MCVCVCDGTCLTDSSFTSHSELFVCCYVTLGLNLTTDRTVKWISQLLSAKSGKMIIESLVRRKLHFALFILLCCQSIQ